MRVLNKEQNEFLSELSKAMSEKLLNFALVRLYDIHSSNDAVQETFLAASENIEEVMESKNPYGWLMKTLRFKVMHEQKARSSFFLEMPLHEMEYLSDRTSVYEAETEIRKILMKAEYEVLRFIYVEGYSVRETAEILGITYEACRKRVQTAKRKLAQEIE